MPHAGWAKKNQKKITQGLDFREIMIILYIKRGRTPQGGPTEARPKNTHKEKHHERDH